MIQLFGAGVGIAFVVTFIAANAVYFSTWCMASAVLSCFLYLAIGSPSRSYPKFRLSSAS
jgi:hypothetical protein